MSSFHLEVNKKEKTHTGIAFAIATSIGLYEKKTAEKMAFLVNRI